jgi:hypothetical protein
MWLDQIRMTAWTRSRLYEHGVTTVDEVRQLGRDFWRTRPRIGVVTLREIETVIGGWTLDRPA